MDDLLETLSRLAIAGAIMWTFFRALLRATLAPLHAKLDRLIELQEQRNDAGARVP